MLRSSFSQHWKTRDDTHTRCPACTWIPPERFFLIVFIWDIRIDIESIKKMGTIDEDITRSLKVWGYSIFRLLLFYEYMNDTYASDDNHSRGNTLQTIKLLPGHPGSFELPLKIRDS